MHIRANDTVEVITGDDAGARGRVLKVNHDAGTIVVEGVNRVYKHVKRSQRNPQGGRLSKEMPVRWSNVLLICTACGQPTRTGARFLAHDGGVSVFLIYSGKHQGRWDTCSDCHTPGQAYAATAALRCLDCHAEVQTGKHAGENYTPTDCVQAGCHANGSKE